MKIIISKSQLSEAPEVFMRRAGYAYLRDRHTGQDSFVRRLSGNFYPRFHVYLVHMGENVIFNLHLDQKKPSYDGMNAHSGEYDSEIVKSEAARIRSLIGERRTGIGERESGSNKKSEDKKPWWKIFS